MRREKWACRACGKTAYDSYSRAFLAMDRIAEISERDVIPLRVYECPYYNGYHMTHMKEERVLK